MPIPFVVPFEVQAVRSAVGVALVIGCLGLTGCSLFGKKQTAQNTPSKPFLGSTSTPAKTETVALPNDSDGPLPGANGLLAGQCIAYDTGKPIRAVIQWKNLEADDAKAAPLNYWTNDEGYFTIPMLKVGGHYELIARAKEGGDLISQKVIVKPPKANLLLQLDKRFTTSSTPPLPDAPSAEPGKKRSSSEGSSDRSSNVIIEPPVRLPSDDQPPGGMGTSPASDNGSGAGSGSANPPNPSNIAEGFRRAPMSQPATIPNAQERNPWPPPLPSHSQWENVPDPRQPQPPAVSPSPGSVRLPNVPTPVPSCRLLGDRLENFALKDIDDRVWEYSRDRKGRLVLLDFWYHNCPPCLLEIPHLIALQRDYGPYGLEVVSIACETGPLAQKKQNVRNVRSRYQINYTTLLSGGGNGPCPVTTQLDVDFFPKLVLIDNDGKILWKSTRQGMDNYARESLRKVIDDKLIQR